VGELNFEIFLQTSKRIGRKKELN